MSTSSRPEVPDTDIDPSTYAGATSLVEGLMVGYRPDFQQGYSPESAWRAAIRRWGRDSLSADGFTLNAWAIGFHAGLCDHSMHHVEGVIVGLRDRVGYIESDVTLLTLLEAATAAYRRGVAVDSDVSLPVR